MSTESDTDTDTEEILDVETVSLDNIRPYHRNPVNHRDSVEHVVDSIRQFGFRVPIILTADNEIVSGHGRFKAAQKLSGTLTDRITELRDEARDKLAENLQVVHDGELFAVYDTELDSYEISEYRITDNRLTELSEWNDDLLTDELERLDADETMPGFTETELADMVESYEITVDVDGDTSTDTDLDEAAADAETTSVELMCPECLEAFELSEEVARMELNLLDK